MHRNAREHTERIRTLSSEYADTYKQWSETKDQAMNLLSAKIDADRQTKELADKLSVLKKQLTDELGEEQEER